MSDNRSLEQIREHYEVERQLAARLRNASKDERRTLYASVYEELFRRVPHHMQLTAKVSPAVRNQQIQRQLRLIKPFLRPDASFLEIGAGDCAVVFVVSGLVESTYAVEVSPTIAANETVPDNFRLLLSDGSSIPVPDGEIDVAYSNQLMEHLHPDDAMEQLRNVFKALRSRGVYICITPNRLSGPHDVSGYFENVATGFHLKEYTVTELNRLFRRVGFRKTMLFTGFRGRFMRMPIWLVTALEAILELLPASLRRRIGRTKVIRHLIDIQLVGQKP